MFGPIILIIIIDNQSSHYNHYHGLIIIMDSFPIGLVGKDRMAIGWVCSFAALSGRPVCLPVPCNANRAPIGRPVLSRSL